MKMTPSLVIMAAGMGSRYGGLKQIDPVDKEGHILIDFSLYDAINAGFHKIVFVIKKEIEKDFKEKIGERIEKIADVRYVYQEIDNVPDATKIPEKRTKPWGTGHAILCCENVINEPFAVINADDYYGQGAFKMIYDALCKNTDENEYYMVGYELMKTLTDYGYVSRGVCKVTDNGYLKTITERTKIEKKDGRAVYTESDGNLVELPSDITVSMNLWGFTPTVFKGLSEGFERFMNEEVTVNPEKAEFFLPSEVQRKLLAKEASVKVLKSPDEWFGVTYKEDKPRVIKAIEDLKKAGAYPEGRLNNI
jgi:UTP-glucose-1-phosphate uridylyltransferase